MISALWLIPCAILCAILCVLAWVLGLAMGTPDDSERTMTHAHESANARYCCVCLNEGRRRERELQQFRRNAVEQVQSLRMGM